MINPIITLVADKEGPSYDFLLSHVIAPDIHWVSCPSQAFMNPDFYVSSYMHIWAPFIIDSYRTLRFGMHFHSPGLKLLFLTTFQRTKNRFRQYLHKVHTYVHTYVLDVFCG
jgi:hypothetical protein